MSAMTGFSVGESIASGIGSMLLTVLSCISLKLDSATIPVESSPQPDMPVLRAVSASSSSSIPGLVFGELSSELTLCSVSELGVSTFSIGTGCVRCVSSSSSISGLLFTELSSSELTLSSFSELTVRSGAVSGLLFRQHFQ